LQERKNLEAFDSTDSLLEYIVHTQNFFTNLFLAGDDNYLGIQSVNCTIRMF